MKTAEKKQNETPDRQSLLEDELILVRNSGEIPEIALHASLYYLTEDADGPKLVLQDQELEALYGVALERAREIVLRDLEPRNRTLTIFRGPARSMVNWRRLQDFCARIHRCCPGFDKRVAGALIKFLEAEIRDVGAGRRTSSVNCSAGELERYCRELSLHPSFLPAGWTELCMK
ncbi:MAG TPA: hypothetical protein ENN06_00875 [Desulfobacteraceae bacterium]|nr:hypothetical protein [Desulfobacteraceae bacterium]